MWALRQLQRQLGGCGPPRRGPSGGQASRDASADGAACWRGASGAGMGGDLCELRVRRHWRVYIGGSTA
eukprot:11162290-Alexandrium_andersonii.AAC.1